MPAKYFKNAVQPVRVKGLLLCSATNQPKWAGQDAKCSSQNEHKSLFCCYIAMLCCYAATQRE